MSRPTSAATSAREGARVYDEGLANAEVFICLAASVGSGQNRKTAEAGKTLCLGDGAAALDIVAGAPSSAPISAAS